MRSCMTLFTASTAFANLSLLVQISAILRSVGGRLSNASFEDDDVTLYEQQLEFLLQPEGASRHPPSHAHPTTSGFSHSPGVSVTALKFVPHDFFTDFRIFRCYITL